MSRKLLVLIVKAWEIAVLHSFRLFFFFFLEGFDGHVINDTFPAGCKENSTTNHNEI